MASFLLDPLASGRETDTKSSAERGALVNEEEENIASRNLITPGSKKKRKKKQRMENVVHGENNDTLKSKRMRVGKGEATKELHISRKAIDKGKRKKNGVKTSRDERLNAEDSKTCSKSLNEFKLVNSGGFGQQSINDFSGENDKSLKKKKKKHNRKKLKQIKEYIYENAQSIEPVKDQSINDDEDISTNANGNLSNLCKKKKTSAKFIMQSGESCKIQKNYSISNVTFESSEVDKTPEVKNLVGKKSKNLKAVQCHKFKRSIKNVNKSEVTVLQVEELALKKSKKRKLMLNEGLNCLDAENITQGALQDRESLKKSKKKQKKKTSKSQNQTCSSKKTLRDKVMNDISFKLNNRYSKEDCKSDITETWKQSSDLYKENGLQVLSYPFRCTYIPSFLQDEQLLQKVKEELENIEFIQKNNDLYKFQQTSDLKKVTSPYISKLREFLYGDFRKWLIDVTGIELNEMVDMGSSKYSYTDVLLCHDDELEGRRIAYILYLVPEWSSKDGGTLDLFITDEHWQPKNIVESLVPSWNTFAFFEVSPVSFHQVNEVLSKDKIRLSINGWFHGADIKRPPKYVRPPKPLLLPSHIEQEDLYSWINPSYLDMDTQKSIRKKFQRDSEIELESFLSVERYEELLNALRSKKLRWLKSGPANKQSCLVLKDEHLPEIVSNCCKFMKSEAVFLILSQLTGLKLHHLAPPDSDPDSDEEDGKKDSSPGMTLSIRKWCHSCYTLIRDGDQGNQCSALDAMLFLGVPKGWELDHGGFTSYIAKDEDEELLTVVPRSNCFALVYRDVESVRFTKYVNASVLDLGKEKNYFDISCSYFE
ncbi:Prolyl 3-hydroxylase ogfod1 [Halocaridina rubra]|uniref:uS12 prolyl 3-hydroxylase n=2 Tax=Halocaridina rubra TaxID=373956 RepID=A0AAN8XGX7_HALRR